MNRRRTSRAGVTLIEVLVAITLLSMLSAGIVVAMQIGLATFAKTEGKLMINRRVSGAQRLLEQELEGLMPVVAPCGGASGAKAGFFQGEAQTMRLVTGFSLAGAWRGQPQVVELFVIPGEDGKGVRLVVNEIPYAGPSAAGALCVGMGPDPLTGANMLRFAPPVAGPTSFVLGDKLAWCHFSFLTPNQQPQLPPVWAEVWAKPGWPAAIRVDMAPLAPDPSRLQPISVVAPVYIHRGPEIPYADF